MNRLISAHMTRLRRDKVFWLCLVTILVYAIAYMLNGCRQAAVLSEFSYTLDKYYFHFALTAGGFMAVFAGMFLGTEYSDRVIRNKVIAGHTRTAIYLSNFIVTFIASLAMLFTWIIGAMVGIPYLGPWEMDAGQLMIYLLVAVLFIAALSSIFTLVGSLSSNKAVTVIVTIILYLVMFLFSSMIYSSLMEPEMLNNLVFTGEGFEVDGQIPNPNYVSGAKRMVYEFINDFLPTSQGAQMAFVEIADPVRMMLSSVFITVSVTLCGLFFFHRKDIK